MYQSTSPQDHDGRTRRSLPARPDPAIDKEPRWVGLGRGTYPFSTYADVSAAYCATVQRLGLGVSGAPPCEVLDDAGNVVAVVAFNGRVFGIRADGEADYATVLHERGGV